LDERSNPVRRVATVTLGIAPVRGHIDGMGQSFAIVVAGAMIATSLLITNHWTLYAGASDFTTAVRLNRWTGAIDICFLNTNSLAGAKTLEGARLECSRP
jgi:hypothetical protein